MTLPTSPMTNVSASERNVRIATWLFATLLSAWNTGCGLAETRTDIVRESRLSTLPLSEQEQIRSLMTNEDRTDIFHQAIKIEFGPYTLLRSIDTSADGLLYVIRNGRIIAEIDGKTLRGFKDNPHAPLPETESVRLSPTDIYYAGPQFSFHDFGFNGIDLQYENQMATHGTGLPKPNGAFTSFLSGLDCKQLDAVLPEFSCCRSKDNNWFPYQFSPDAGWHPTHNERMRKACLKYNETQSN